MNSPVIPYLTCDDAAAAIEFYIDGFGAVEQMRVVGDDGRIGHASLTVGPNEIYLSDEHPEIGVLSPSTLGGTPVAIHLVVLNVDDTAAAATAAGATIVGEPADQPHGARTATLIDPFGHRWMLSHPIGDVTPADYQDQMSRAGYTVTGRSKTGAIWAALNLADAQAGIRFVVDVLGFEETLVVPGEIEGEVVHSQLTWPEGGVLQAASANRDGNVFSAKPTGAANLYIITADPTPTYERCLNAGATIVNPLSTPDHDPTGQIFTVQDAEGNLFSFGTYAGEG